MDKKRTIEDIWKEEDGNKTYYYEADGRLVKEVNNEDGIGRYYTYMEDTDEWVLGSPSFFLNERVKITEARCEALVDAVRMNR